MTIINKDVVAVKALLEMPLVIPDYQRPYKWQARHVNQLLDDVIHHRNKNSYRLGTVVLHQEPDQALRKLNIVDGQQRLLTLTLLCHALDTSKICSPQLLERNFCSSISVANLKHNAAIIQSRLNQLSETDREELVDFLLHKCELICVTLDDLSEAFQFFDSQNARGKELEPYDLLKAFHLREMAHNTESERTACVEQWENEVSPEDKNTPSLHTIMSDLLFRIRRWTDGESGREFSRTNVDVFKGVNLRSTSYRFTEQLRGLDYMVDNYNADGIRHWDQQAMVYPFQIDQTMLNGKRFFEYIQHYIGIYQTLFVEDKPELHDLLRAINSYEGRNRTGDHYVRNLFCCALMYYYDRFGDVELQKAANLCFAWSYRIRLIQNRVAIESIDNPAMHQYGLFRAISQALHPHDVLAYTVPPVKASEVSGTKVDGLISQFREMRYYNDEQ